MIGSRVSGEFVNHSIASLAEGNDERLSGVRMMDGCSRWGMDEGTKDGNDALDFFFYFQRQKSRRRRWGWQREGGKFFEHWRLNWGFRDEFFKATTQQSHWQSIKKNKKKTRQPIGRGPAKVLPLALTAIILKYTIGAA